MKVRIRLYHLTNIAVFAIGLVVARALWYENKPPEEGRVEETQTSPPVRTQDEPVPVKPSTSLAEILALLSLLPISALLH